MEEHGQGAPRGWFLWTPERAPGGREHLAYPDITEAVEEFEPVDRAAGHAAKLWLIDESSHAYNDTETETWLLYDGVAGSHRRVEAFFAIRKSFFYKRGTWPWRRKRAACEIVALCKHRHSEITGLEVHKRAISQAQKMRPNDPEVILSIDGYNRETTELLFRRYIFWRKAPDGLHLWMPLKPKP